VAVGLSGGFLEPLESSGIGLIETAAYLVSYLFPHDGDFAPVAKTFNEMMKARYERIVDFVKLHYCLTQRKDHPSGSITPTWRACRTRCRTSWPCGAARAAPHGLRGGLRDVSAIELAVCAVRDGVSDRLVRQRQTLPRMDEARHEFAMIEQVSQRALADLPTTAPWSSTCAARRAQAGLST
jgi:tryptophan halogenase